MHAIFASIGTDGDILPFLGLAARLRARGHRVTFFAAEDYGELITSHQIEFRQFLSAELMGTLLANPDFWHPIKTARFTAKWGRALIEPQYRLIKSIAADPESVLISNPAVFGASLAAETLGRPLCHVILQPWMIHSAVAPALMPIAGLPRWAPRVMHSLFYYAVDLAADVLFGPTLNRVRRSLGLKPMRRILHNWLSRDLVIGMFPEWFGPPQSDWPTQVRLTGFPRFDGAIDRSPPVGLPEFLQSPKPTVVFTFGSGMMHARQLFAAATRVCAALECQGVTINRHYQPTALPPNMFHADFIPFRNVFPRCSAVVHHGGIGTTAEAMAAGTPQLILPIGFDQLDNGDRVKRLGLGLHTASKHNLITKDGRIRDRDISEIASALRRLFASAARERCRAFAKRFENDDPLNASADLVERLAQRSVH